MYNYFNGFETVNITKEDFLEMFTFTYELSLGGIDLIREVGQALLIDYYFSENDKSYTKVFENVHGTWLYQYTQ